MPSFGSFPRSPSLVSRSASLTFADPRPLLCLRLLPELPEQQPTLSGIEVASKAVRVDSLEQSNFLSPPAFPNRSENLAATISRSDAAPV